MDPPSYDSVQEPDSHSHKPLIERFAGDYVRDDLVFLEDEEQDLYRSLGDLAVAQPQANANPRRPGSVVEGPIPARQQHGRAPVPPTPLPRSISFTKGAAPRKPAQPPPPVPPRRRAPLSQSQKRFSCDLTRPASKLNRSNTSVDNHQNKWEIDLIDTPQGSTKSLASLSMSTSNLLSKCQPSDPESNSGLVWGCVVPVHLSLLQGAEVTVVVSTVWNVHQLPLTALLDGTVEDLIVQILVLLEQPAGTSGQYLLKLCDSEEYLHNECLLGMYESLQAYHKLALEVPVRLLHVSALKRHLARDAEDLKAPCHLYKLLGSACVYNKSRVILQGKLNCYSKEVKELLCSKSDGSVCFLVDEVRTILNLLGGISNSQLEEAIGSIRRILPNPQNQFQNQFPIADCESALDMLHQALAKVIQVFFENFHSDFRGQAVLHGPPAHSVDLNTDILQLNIAALYTLQATWLHSFDFFSISCELTYGGKRICELGISDNISTALALGTKIQCNRLMMFPVPINQLPYESMLTFRLLATKQGKSPELLRWAVLPLYSQKTLVTGTVLLSMSMLVELAAPPCPALSDSHRHPDGVIVQLEFPDQYEWRFERPVALPESFLSSPPCEELQRKVSEVSEKHCLCFLSDNEKALLWCKRHVCDSGSTYLHLLLSGAPRWQPEDLTEIYTIVEHWTLKGPEEALFLLADSFHDPTVRRAAVQYLEKLSDGELLELLPQLVQALKSEWELCGPLVTLLLGRSLKSVRVAQQLHWLLVDAQHDVHFQSWFSKVHAALRHCCGRTLRLELETESRLVSLLTHGAERVRTADKTRRKDILTTLKCKMEDFFREGTGCRLPLDPAVWIKGIDVNACKLYNSHAVPLGVSFLNSDPLGRNVSVICKTGDNLRQDMLVLQVVRLMDRVWLQEGLDMRMVTYRCLSTGRDQGLVEVVPEAVTLGKIHQEFGLGGTLREDTLDKWFHMWNKTEEGFEEAVMNFLHSCAGWCVATFVLGICDRHNDNIMLKHSGHMFHIDFGKIMGNAQKFANIKRDRTPFIFTSEMQHFITGGGKKPQRLHRFVELCCGAYNSIRRRTALVLSLLQLMLGAGMPEMKDIQDLQYVHNNLRPQDSDLKATSYFTKKIKESMGSFPVKLNFLLHTMVQLPVGKKPAPTALTQDSSPSTNIQEAVIQSYTAKGKDVTYDLRVTIEDGYIRSEKTMTQLELIHKQLQKHFIESSLPQFPCWYKMSFTPNRRMSQLNKYLKELFEGPCKGNEFVCSLFLDGPKTASLPVVGKEENPQIQLFMSFREHRLSILVKHLKSIKSANGTNPDAYVVIRLRPDPHNRSKKRTKVVRDNGNPTFNELLEYSEVSSLEGKVLEVTVKSRKTCVVSTNIRLEESRMETEEWHPLGQCSV
ncbi:phosphatidylinositol 3-kinase C2 domain-containing subunit gamma [Aplochiton taeniatus]